MDEGTAYPQELFTDPRLSCDIIMKGGITSGVVYPLAVCELAKEYRFRNIGGTSAGAIAAAAAAAAEFGRDKGGFTKFAQLPDFLQEKLTSLFQPSRETRPVFVVLLTWLQPGSRFKKVVRSVLAILRDHGLGAVAGAGLGLLLFLLLVVLPATSLHPTGGWIVGLLFALAGGLLGASTAFVIGGLRGIENNFFGLCTGSAPARPGTDPPLTPWLADLLDDIAGKTDGPLTFADLWGQAEHSEMLRKEEDSRLRNVNLEVMTTNLTHGWPLRLPFASREFFFHPRDFEQLFPPRIVQWMLSHPPAPRSEEDEWLYGHVAKSSPLRPLPDPAQLPVVVAARMSLSFPVLISAVPLYTVDWSLEKNKQAKKLRQPLELERCWFSDGGIGSNFPVHFFDQLLPSRPTFGINLRPFHPDHPKKEDEAENVWFSERAGQGLAPSSTAISGLLSFLTTIVNTMQNWVDNTQTRLPGYRDRVVHVHLTDDEGGLNLVMPPERIQALTQRGQAAGRKLSHFNWDAHRWTRYRSAMAQLQDKLERMERVYSQGFKEFLDQRDPEANPYKQSNKWKGFALEGTQLLMELVGKWRSHEKYRFTDSAPRPTPDLRITPRR
jgi:predicted acylesterase/phospholipase RssA